MSDNKLSSIEEHFVKKLLLKLELEHEIALLDDPLALRQFGYPFSPQDPSLDNSKKKQSSNIFSSSLGVPGYSNSSNRNSVISLVSANTREGNDVVSMLDNGSILKESPSTEEFYLLNYFLKEFIMKFPLFNSGDDASKVKFWQQRVQPFYEYFMSLHFSDSLDRERFSKRKMMSIVITKLVYSLFDSNLITVNEQAYYSQDKKLYTQEHNIQKKTRIKRLGIGMCDTITYLVTTDPIIINGWDINIIGVLENNTKALDKIKEQKKTKKISIKATTSSSSKFGMSSTTKWMKSAFSMSSSSSSAFFSKITTGNSSVSPISLMYKPTHYFILEISYTKTNKSSHKYLQKSYYDFIEFSNLLRKEFPAKKLPKLPHKQKATDTAMTSHGTMSTSSSNLKLAEAALLNDQLSDMNLNNSHLTVPKSNEKSQDDAIEDDQSAEFNYDYNEENDTDFGSSSLSRDITRTSFRQYLRKLTDDSEISASKSLFTFLNSNEVQLDSLPSEIQEDIDARKSVDISNLQEEVQNQEGIETLLDQLNEAVSDVKSKLKDNNTFLKSIITEVKTHNELSLMSDTIQQSIQWLKFFIASVIYKMFLGKSGNRGLYGQVKMLHNLIPYTMMSQIMKITNPMSIMKGMTDLFLSQPFGGYSLFQTMFITIITEDVRSSSKVIKKLEKKLLEESNGSQHVIDCLKLFVEKNQISNDISIDEVREESNNMDMPMVLIVLMKYVQLKKLSQKDVDDVIESFTSWKVQENSDGVITESEKQKASYFANLKELQKLYFKLNDKKLMKKVWQDTMLAQLLKAVVNLIYDPMVKLFNIADVDLGLKLFERFMTDLIRLIDDVNYGRLGTSTKFDIICRINDLLGKYQDEFLSLANHFLNNDKNGVVDEYVDWVESILKFVNNDTVVGSHKLFDIESMSENSDIDMNKIKNEVNSFMTNKFEKREIYNELCSLWKQKTKIMAQNSKIEDENERLVNLKNAEAIGSKLNILEEKYRSLIEATLDSSELKKCREEVFSNFIRDKYFV